MNITSAVVYSAPRSQDVVRAQLITLAGVQIHTETEDGRFIITVEDVPGVSAADTVVRVHQLEGVQFAAMVYQYCDDELQREEAQS